VIREKEVTYRSSGPPSSADGRRRDRRVATVMDVFFEYGHRGRAAARRAAPLEPPSRPVLRPPASVGCPPVTLPARPDEKGDPALFSAPVTDLDGSPWWRRAGRLHADERGYYSGFARTSRRATCAPWWSPTPTAGSRSPRSARRRTRSPPTGQPAAAPRGRLARLRPAHLHLLVQAPGYRRITTQLYFAAGLAGQRRLLGHQARNW